MPHARRLLGDAGERAAERELARRGIRLVERNARTRYGEIDLVCHDGGSYVFIEVKTRRASSFVPAIEAVDWLKLARLEHLAQAWLVAKGLRSVDWRLVLLALTVGDRRTTAELVDIGR